MLTKVNLSSTVTSLVSSYFLNVLF